MRRERKTINWVTLDGFELNGEHKKILVIRDRSMSNNNTIIKYICKNQPCQFLLREIINNGDKSITYQSNTNNEHICFSTDNKFLNDAKIKLFVDDLCKTQKYLSPQEVNRLTNLKFNVSVPRKTIYQNMRVTKKNFKGYDDDLYLDDVKNTIMSENSKSHDIILKFFEIPFFLYISSKTNIEKLKHGKHFNIEFTYKIVTLDFPLLVFGFTDINRIFHLVCLCLARFEDENTVELCIKTTVELCKDNGIELKIESLTSDYEKQFSNPFLKFNPNIILLKCWFHTSQLLKKKLDSKLDMYKPIMQDINFMQSLPTKILFKAYAKLFIKKYSDFSCCQAFLDYFTKDGSFIDNCMWFEGASILAPSTNNSCEGFNSGLKRYFESKRQDIRSFIEEMHRFLIHFSSKEVSIKPHYDKNWITNTHSVNLIKTVQYIDKIEYWFENNTDKENTTGIPIITNKDICMELLLNADGTTVFRQLFYKYSFVICNEPIRNITDIYCSCFAFVKRKGCIHVLKVLTVKNLTSFVNLPLTGPKKKGRPKKTATTMKADAEFFKQREI